MDSSEIFIKDIQRQLLCLRWTETLLLGGSTAAELEFWDTDKALILNKQSAHDRAISCIDVQNKTLVTGGKDGIICLWKPEA